MTDSEDILSESLQTLYDYTPITHSSAGSLFTYNCPEPLWRQYVLKTSEALPPSIILRTPDTQSAHWSLHASSIWVSSLYVADHLADLQLDRHLQSAAARDETLYVLELGAGAGLPGILIAKCYDNISVVSSDYPDECLIETLAGNIERNDVRARCCVVPYAWGSEPSVLLEKVTRTHTLSTRGFDAILAADTLWNPELHHLFVETLCSTLRKSEEARIYLVAGLHTGRYTIQAFLNVVHGAGLEVEEAIEREINGDGQRPWKVERGENETEKDRRRWVVWLSLKWVSL
ncbi:hypothetical protein AcW1_006392 [Taiwanofungus camphoratus]|nr:hypothetical protein AcW2_005154 [Antrodia cinnamomea]KAI0954522.1 hypothetical protein AcW1_006392 [Antrodia cinnamomea]